MYLFTYGTLRTSLKGFADGTKVGDGTIAGILLDLGPFPGLVLRDENADAPRVTGALWRLHVDGDEDPFAELDFYEGAKRTPPLYFRKQVTVTLTDGSVVPDVWVYEFNDHDNDFDGRFDVVRSGDWFNK